MSEFVRKLPHFLETMVNYTNLLSNNNPINVNLKYFIKKSYNKIISKITKVVQFPWFQYSDFQVLFQYQVFYIPLSL